MSGNEELLARIEETLSRGLKLCIITRGAPGRGKTTIAEEIVRHCTNNGKFNAEIASADDYMIDSLGWLCISTLRNLKSWSHLAIEISIFSLLR